MISMSVENTIDGGSDEIDPLTCLGTCDSATCLDHAADLLDPEQVLWNLLANRSVRNLYLRVAA